MRALNVFVIPDGADSCLHLFLALFLFTIACAVVRCLRVAHHRIGIFNTPCKNRCAYVFARVGSLSTSAEIGENEN